ncbi:carboxypeptidase-like regulatory domain-containing protein [Duncaniella freteri]|uniref:carboxypeptidase-like regulatory domain-containing protein n=3 Tax=Duncaniella TaxID=2518495 RepID=UPI00256FE2BE|nr:carboxypeptidase-like regulatory domain-containing protein [Duncaniella freteri]
MVSAQDKTVSGTVIDETGEPVIGATVMVKGSKVGIATDIDGKYTLNTPPQCFNY